MRGLDSGVLMRAVAGSSLEWKLTDALAFGLTTASPLQRAVCRAADGRPLEELSLIPEVAAAFGNCEALPDVAPREIFLLSGIRTAKSLTAACGAFHMATTCDVSSLRPGEIPRVSVVSLRKDLADVIMNHLVGSVTASPLLRPFLMGDPKDDTVVLRHPVDGRPVEIKVVAGSRAGASLVARWSAGCIFDEFPRMVGGDEAVVNWDDSRQAVLLRLLRGCQLWHIGSPWAPYGPAYETVTEHHGKPTPERIVIRAPAPAMNPVYWTKERVDEARRLDPHAAKTDVDAEFASPAEAMFSLESITRCTRVGASSIPRKPGNSYTAAMDPATSGNGWTLIIGTREAGRTIIVHAQEWRGTPDQPLDPGEVIKDVALVLQGYGLSVAHSDQVMGQALVTLARQQGVTLVQWTIARVEQAKKFLSIRTDMDLGRIELPPIAQLRTDLLHVKKVPTPAGVSIKYPVTSDGRHCDYAPSLMLVLTKLIPDPSPPKVKTEDDETTRMREAMKAKFCKPTEAW